MKNWFLHFKFVLLLCLFSQMVNAQNPLWVMMDKILINKYVNFFLKDSAKMPDLFLAPRHGDTTFLGKGFYTIDRMSPGGYISVAGKFLFRNDTLIEYKLDADMPDEVELREKYKAWYSRIFSFKDSFELIPIYSNYRNWIAPLPQYDGPLNVMEQSPLFQEFISTESGDIFGYWNGWYGLHKNRDIFEELLPELNQEKFYLLMYSKNPISRMQAFYYYLTHENEFETERKARIYSWMNEILEDPPQIKSAEGDIIETYPTKERMMFYVNIDLEAAKNPDPDSCSYFSLGRFRGAMIDTRKRDSLSYLSDCPLISLELSIVDRRGQVIGKTSSYSNPLNIDFSEKVTTNGKEEYKFKEGQYFWIAEYAMNTPKGIVKRKTSGSLYVFR